MGREYHQYYGRWGVDLKPLNPTLCADVSSGRLQLNGQKKIGGVSLLWGILALGSFWLLPHKFAVNPLWGSSLQLRFDVLTVQGHTIVQIHAFGPLNLNNAKIFYQQSLSSQVLHDFCFF